MYREHGVCVCRIMNLAFIRCCMLRQWNKKFASNIAYLLKAFPTVWFNFTISQFSTIDGATERYISVHRVVCLHLILLMYCWKITALQVRCNPSDSRQLVLKSCLLYQHAICRQNTHYLHALLNVVLVENSSYIILKPRPLRSLNRTVSHRL